MKKLILVAHFLLLSLAITAQNLFVGSYNIRYKNKWDEEKGHLWKNRCRVICEQINFESPEIFGAQEVLHEQLTDMLQGLKGYDYIGVGRDDGKQAGEYAAIFYKKNELKKLNEGHFWLSETPNKPSLGWDAACIRICTWGKFKVVSSGLVFYFFNLHTDHVGVKARRESAKLVLERIKSMVKPNEAVVLTGDFNVDQHDETYEIFTHSHLLNDSYAVAKQVFAENGTFNEFDTNTYTTSRIDHIFVSKRFQVENYGILTNGYWTEDTVSDSRKGNDAPQQIRLKHFTKRNASDHYPVFVKLNWTKNKH